MWQSKNKIGGDFQKRMYGLARRCEEWNIGLVYEPISVFLETRTRRIIHWLPTPKAGTYIADPFALIRNGRIHILCEQFDYRTSKGRIVCIEINEQGLPSEPKVAIDLPVHVSYPYILEREGEIYCIPETAEAREIALYKAEEFPVEWTRLKPLVDNFPGLDVTVFEYEKRWWLSCTAWEGRSSHRLFVWHASDLLGPWKPHAANPVKTDIRSSRPAGTPFLHSGCLYRPAQDCSRTYGGRIVLNRVVRLTPTEFKEEQAAVVEPYPDGPYPDGLHTLSSLGNITVLDGKRFVKFRRLFSFLQASTGILRPCRFPRHGAAP